MVSINGYIMYGYTYMGIYNVKSVWVYIYIYKENIAGARERYLARKLTGNYLTVTGGKSVSRSNNAQHLLYWFCTLAVWHASRSQFKLNATIRTHTYPVRLKRRASVSETDRFVTIY